MKVTAILALEESKLRFLVMYKEYLEKIESNVEFVMESYRIGDADIGNRLLSGTLEGLDPYSTDNVTMVSIFSKDDGGMDSLKVFNGVVKTAKNIEESIPIVEERIEFLKDRYIPEYEKWLAVVQRKIGELKLNVEHLQLQKEEEGKGE
ncbi:hypothetical protein [Evansella tamaricis]|uniref:DUF8042 domain-containing protein n=1 Tax=Evansella tamaricis TaxID=2069301 RepID=A0ABS6JGH5_9BACI|nr:hypothetical protein [Evansella tamaricis]MBU9712801.1 hypothetical protein [Evansella tamaricis]